MVSAPLPSTVQLTVPVRFTTIRKPELPDATGSVNVCVLLVAVASTMWSALVSAVVPVADIALYAHRKPVNEPMPFHEILDTIVPFVPLALNVAKKPDVCGAPLVLVAKLKAVFETWVLLFRNVH